MKKYVLRTLLVLMALVTVTFGPMHAYADSAIPGDNVRFLYDLGSEDGETFLPGSTFSHGWELENTSDGVSWAGRSAVRVTTGLAYDNFPQSIYFPDCEPGHQTGGMSTFQAPYYAGHYHVEYKIVLADGRIAFPDKAPLYVDFNVSSTQIIPPHM